MHNNDQQKHRGFLANYLIALGSAIVDIMAFVPMFIDVQPKFILSRPQFFYLILLISSLTGFLILVFKKDIHRRTVSWYIALIFTITALLISCSMFIKTSARGPIDMGDVIDDSSGQASTGERSEGSGETVDDDLPEGDLAGETSQNTSNTIGNKEENDLTQNESPTLYSFRDREYKDAETAVFEGWELIGSELVPDGTSQKTEWSTNILYGDAVETKVQYRSRVKEESFSMTPNLEGWLSDPSRSITYTYGDWDTSYPASQEGRRIESAEQYRYRDILRHTQEGHYVTDWTSQTPDGMQRNGIEFSAYRSRQSFYYFRYVCENCGHFSSEGNYCMYCGSYELYMEGLWSPESYGDTLEFGVLDTGISYHTINGETFYAYIDPYYLNYVEPSLEYCYTIVEREEVETYGTWSEWSFFEPHGNNIQTESRTVYRAVDTSYPVYRWSEYSAWSDAEITPNENRDVQAQTLYRTEVKNTKTIYHFQRWGDWSDWSENIPDSKNNREIRTNQN